MIYVHHHLGLGDHIICNALVRRIVKQNGTITLAVKKHNYTSVKQLYKDLDIEYHQVETDDDCIKVYPNYTVLRLGFENCRKDWERSFYDQLHIPYSERFSGFYIDRDYKREKTLEESLNLPKTFAFVNKNASTGTADIDIKTELPIAELKPLSDSIFDWIGVLEKSKEIHTIDSSIFQLIKQLPLKGKKFFYDTREKDHSRTLPSFDALAREEEIMKFFYDTREKGHSWTVPSFYASTWEIL